MPSLTLTHPHPLPPCPHRTYAHPPSGCPHLLSPNLTHPHVALAHPSRGMVRPLICKGSVITARCKGGVGGGGIGRRGHALLGWARETWLGHVSGSRSGGCVRGVSFQRLTKKKSPGISDHLNSQLSGYIFQRQEHISMNFAHVRGCFRGISFRRPENINHQLFIPRKVLDVGVCFPNGAKRTSHPGIYFSRKDLLSGYIFATDGTDRHQSPESFRGKECFFRGILFQRPETNHHGCSSRHQAAFGIYLCNGPENNSPWTVSRAKLFFRGCSFPTARKHTTHPGLFLAPRGFFRKVLLSNGSEHHLILVRREAVFSVYLFFHRLQTHQPP